MPIEEIPSNQDPRSGASGPEFADEVADAIDEGIAGRGAGLRAVRRRGRCWRRRGRGRGDGNAFDAALENERGPHANAAYQNNHPGIDLGLDLGFGIVNQRRHKHLIDGFILGGRQVDDGRLDDCGLRRRSRFSGLGLANTVAGASAEVLKLAVEEENIAGLRDENALARQLLFHTDSAEIGANAHGAGGVEANEGVPRPVSDGNGLRLDQGSVNGEREFVLDVRVNGAGIESDGQRASGLEEREMRGAANADLAALDEVDTRGAGFDADITAAAQDGFRLALDNFEAHRSGDGDGFAVDNADRVGSRFVGACSGRGDQCSAESGEAGRREYGSARKCERIGEGCHSLNLPATGAESLAYTIRRVICSRL